MVRPVRMSIIAISVVVLFTMQIGVSAKKKTSKRKNRTARSVPVIVIPSMQRNMPVVVTPPVLSPRVAEDTFFIRSTPTQAAKLAGSSSSPSSAGSGSSPQGSGDSEGKGKRLWLTRPLHPTAGILVISEFRLQGPSGFADEFIEIYNDSGADHIVSGAGAGYGIAASDGILRCTIPNGTNIPAGGHYLCANNSVGGYSLGSYPAGNGNTATPDATYTTQITNGEDTDPDPMVTTPAPRQGIALFNSTLPADFTLANRFDAVGPTEEANTTYKEGTGLADMTPFLIDHSFSRDECGKGGSIPTPGQCSITTPKDTDDNQADFFFVDTNGTNASAGQRLGAPGPQNLSSAIQRNSDITENLLDSTVARQNPPNRVRDFTSVPAQNSTFGTLSIRRRFVNNTGASITSLRFRIIDLTTFPAPSGFADLRPRNSTLVVVSAINDSATCLASTGLATTPCTVNVQGTTLDQPPTQPNGGGFNSSLTAGTVTLGTPLANGASINLQFLLGLQQTGNFRIYVNIEVLP